MATLTLQDRAPLTNNTTSIPKLGFGVYQLYGQSCQKAILAALEAGYRHIDSAQLYRNESDVGAAIQQSGLKREDVFLTTKIRQSAGSAEKSYQSCVESIDKVGGKNGYVDLFLIHIPGTGRESREELWGALEKLYNEGRAKAIGVSNYRPQHIEEMREYAKIWPPHVNQIEVCPFSCPRLEKKPFFFIFFLFFFFLANLCSSTRGASSEKSSNTARIIILYSRRIAPFLVATISATRRWLLWRTSIRSHRPRS